VNAFSCLNSLSTEIPLICHENIPSLILKTRTIIPARVEVRYPEGSIDQIREDARVGYEDFERYGKLEDLEKAILNYQKDMDMTPKDDPELVVTLNNLAACLAGRFEQLGRREDIDDSISRLRDVTNLNQSRDYRSLNNLGNSLKTRYEQYGDPLDLDDAIVQIRKAVDVTPDGHPDKPNLLTSYGAALGRRYERTGDRSDMNDGIAYEQLAADLTPDAHPRKHMFLSNLGGSLQKRFLELGDLSDLDNGIAEQQLSINLAPDGYPQKPMYMSNLGNSLRIRFERLGNISDLNSAISHQRLAVNLTPDGHIEKPMYRICLAASLMRRFERLENLSDLNDAISQQQLAVSLTPDGHPSKAMYINNLGSALDGRFGRLGNVQDLEDAITQGQLASKLAHERHPGKPMYLTNLGNALARRFQQFGNISDINSAIMSHQKAVDLKSNTDPDMPAYLTNLGVSYRIRFRHLAHIMDAEVAIKHLSIAATSSVGSPNSRFKAATLWIMTASSIDHSSLLEAYESALELMPFVAWLGLPLADRHRQLVRVGGIAREAAAAAISLEQYDKALEWLEQGRSIVWTQLLQLRTPIDDLREVDPELAERFLEVSQLLDRGTGEGDMLIGGTHDTEAEGRRYRGLTMEWESIIKKVRSLPNFERFLKPPSSSHLMKAAQNGPVVVLNIAEERCDALALVDGIDEVIHIPLPNITSKRVTELRDELMDQLYSDGVRQRGDTGGRAAKLIGESNSEQDCKHILGELWSCVVKPVLDSLAFSVQFLNLA
jgi:tetratricopeptide (TPR) repeat protein